jgi:hypothetical protein
MGLLARVSNAEHLFMRHGGDMLKAAITNEIDWNILA